MLTLTYSFHWVRKCSLSLIFLWTLQADFPPTCLIFSQCFLLLQVSLHLLEIPTSFWWSCWEAPSWKRESCGPLPGGGSGWSGPIAQWMAASSGSHILLITGSMTPNVCMAAIAACTVTVLLMGMFVEMWSDSAKAANCCSPVLGWIGDRTWICSGSLVVVSLLVSDGAGVQVCDVWVSDASVMWQSSSAVNLLR